MERRCKVVPLDTELIADLLRPGRNGLTVTLDDGLVPEDARLERVWYEIQMDCFMVVFSHPSWDEVPLGEHPPTLHARWLGVRGEGSPLHETLASDTRLLLNLFDYVLHTEDMRWYHALQRADLKTVGDVARLTEEQFLRIQYMGPKGLVFIRDALRRLDTTGEG
jgi:hypothetical protein